MAPWIIRLLPRVGGTADSHASSASPQGHSNTAFRRGMPDSLAQLLYIPIRGMLDAFEPRVPNLNGISIISAPPGSGKSVAMARAITVLDSYTHNTGN